MNDAQNSREILQTAGSTSPSPSSAPSTIKTISLDFEYENGVRLLGTTGPDLIMVAPGNQASGAGGIWGLGENDTIVGSNNFLEKLYGNSGNDCLVGAIGSDILYGGKGADSLDANEGNDFVKGDRGNDDIWGRGGNDILRGGKGRDLIYGGLGNDYLVGDNDVDTLVGNAGADTFVLNTNQLNASVTLVDVIGDFQASDQDRIALDPSLPFGGINTGIIGDFDLDGFRDDVLIQVITPQGVFLNLGVALDSQPSDFQNAFIPADPLIMNAQFIFLP